MSPYYSLNKKETVLLLISFLVLILLMFSAGWIIGNLSRPEPETVKNEKKELAASLSPDVKTTKKVAEAKPNPVLQTPGNSDDDAASSKAAGKTPVITAPQAFGDEEKKAGDTGGSQEKQQAASTSSRFTIVTDTFVVKSKALKRLGELKKKGYAETSVLCFPTSDNSSYIKNYLVQIAHFDTYSAAHHFASEFQTKEKTVAVIRPISLSDLEEKKVKAEEKGNAG